MAGMGRSLMEIVTGSDGRSSESLLSSIMFAVLPIAKVFTMCFMGFLMASKRVNILTGNGRKLLNGAILLYKNPPIRAALDDKSPITQAVYSSAETKRARIFTFEQTRARIGQTGSKHAKEKC